MRLLSQCVFIAAAAIVLIVPAAEAAGPKVCQLDNFSRGIGKPLTDCPAGFKRFAAHCVEVCPPQVPNSRGLICTGKNGRRHFVLIKRAPKALTCAPQLEKHGLLCYKPCGADYQIKGLECYQKTCPPGFPHKCGGQLCTVDAGSCTKSWFNGEILSTAFKISNVQNCKEFKDGVPPANGPDEGGAKEVEPVAAPKPEEGGEAQVAEAPKPVTAPAEGGDVAKPADVPKPEAPPAEGGDVPKPAEAPAAPKPEGGGDAPKPEAARVEGGDVARPVEGPKPETLSAADEEAYRAAEEASN